MRVTQRVIVSSRGGLVVEPRLYHRGVRVGAGEELPMAIFEAELAAWRPGVPNAISRM